MLAGIQFTKEDAELDVVPSVSQGLEDAVSAFVIGDIVGDKITVSHGQRVSMPG